MGNGVAFTQVVKTIVPLFARMRNQYWVLGVRPVCVSVVVFAATVTVVRACVKSAFVERSTVKPVSLLELSAQDRITLRALFLFGPLTTPKLLGAAGSAGSVTEAVLLKAELPPAFVAATR